jgi:sigma-B regulation protein RsbU (phosphoserine phosphatase)
MGLPPTGKPFRTTTVFLYTFGNDHKIVHERRMYDFSRLLLHLSGDTEPATEGPRLYRELLERAQREHELKIAAEIQRALLPQSRYTGTGFEVAATSVPCRAIGGDFFDYFTLTDGTFSFVLGDVAGKGPPAALLAAVLQGIFTANAHRGLGPAMAIREANDALVRRAIEARFATAVYGALSPDGSLTYCNAGHNPPLLIGKRGIMRLETGGLVVGAFAAAFDEQTLRLEPGDTLVIYSDGITEARNPDGEEFGEEQLLCCVMANRDLAPTELLECIFDAVHQFSAGSAQSDDLTLLALRFAGG